jgi:hypothetical protein
MSWQVTASRTGAANRSHGRRWDFTAAAGGGPTGPAGEDAPGCRAAGRAEARLWDFLWEF